MSTIRVSSHELRSAASTVVGVSARHTVPDVGVGDLGHEPLGSCARAALAEWMGSVRGAQAAAAEGARLLRNAASAYDEVESAVVVGARAGRRAW